MTDWIPSAYPPKTKHGEKTEIIIRGSFYDWSTGDYSRDGEYEAVYLNDYPLHYEDCICDSEDDHDDDDGCPTTGFHVIQAGHPDYDDYFGHARVLEWRWPDAS